MPLSARLKRQARRHALVDGIPFYLPINSSQSPVLMAVFTINADKAKKLLPGDEIHPVRLGNKAFLMITVIDYRITDIGNYIEFSIGIGCTHGPRPARGPLALIFMKQHGLGQFVYDLPVSTEISVKGGKGIWGMPKHQAKLNFTIGDRVVSSQYDLDGELAMKIAIKRPKRAWLPMSMGAVNYCQFRGMLMKSYVYFRGKLGFSLFKKGAARLTLGPQPSMQALKALEISRDPVFTAYFPESEGFLDDHFESWFLTYEEPPKETPEGLESVSELGLGREWYEPPKVPVESLERT